MTFPNTSIIRKSTIFLAAAMLSFSAMAAPAPNFNEIQRLANQGSADAQFALGYMYFYGKAVKQDYPTAHKWLEKAANQGNAVAQSLLGGMYYKGNGVRQDYAKAFEWYKKSADQGEYLAQYSLGVMYYYGEGVRQNIATAKELFGKACDNGFQEGCDNYRILNQR